MTDLATATVDGAAMLERVVVGGDLSRLSSAERLRYYRDLCESLGLNPLTRPFQYITLSGRLTLYATKDATEQLRKRNAVSIVRLENHRVDDVYVVTAYAKDGDGREDSSTGAVPLAALKGEALANALMKAETKAKRRVTLSICGLGMLDETEVGAIPDAKVVPVDPQTGELPEVVVRDVPTSETVEQTAERLFPQEDEQAQREALITEIKHLAQTRKIPAKVRVNLAQSVLAGAALETADIAALADLRAAVLAWKAAP